MTTNFKKKIKLKYLKNNKTKKIFKKIPKIEFVKAGCLIL